MASRKRSQGLRCSSTMKIKRFKNLWAMGLIIFGVILIALYLLKFICPEFVVNIAQIEPIVKFGNYVNSHLWAYYLFTTIVSFAIGYFYCCACCRKQRLRLIDVCIVLGQVLLMAVAQRYVPQHYVTLSFVTILLCPTIICLLDKRTEIKYFYSTITTFSIHTLAQLLSLSIREISLIVTQPNVATLNILLIDLFIWVVLLYNYYNYKENK